jgi:hypothetical protein
MTIRGSYLRFLTVNFVSIFSFLVGPVFFPRLLFSNSNTDKEGNNETCKCIIKKSKGNGIKVKFKIATVFENLTSP